MTAAFGYGNRVGADARRNILPELPTAIPHDIRKEVNWAVFSNPVNPLGSPQVYVQAMHDALADGELAYQPDESAYALRRIMAAYYEVPIESVFVGVSPAQCIRAIVQSMGSAKVGLAVPASIDTELAIVNGGSEPVRLKNPFSFATCKYGVARRDDTEFDAAILSNPGYPTSRLLSRDVLAEYLDKCDYVIVDESYVELSLGAESFLPLVTRCPNLFVVRNLAASFAIPGTPVACVFAHPDMISRIVPAADPTANGMASEVLASVFPQLVGYMEETSEYLDREIPWLQYMLSLIPGMHVSPSEGNFILCRFDGSRMDLAVESAEGLSIRLQLAGFLVPQLTRIVGLEGQENYFAIAVQKHENNQKLIRALRRIITR